MADYKELLRRAVEALPENNGAARRAVYEKARAALVGQLRAIHPPLPARDITTHRLQLEDCIRQVEQESSEAVIAGMGGGAAEQPQSPPVYFESNGANSMQPALVKPAPAKPAPGKPTLVAARGAQRAIPAGGTIEDIIKAANEEPAPQESPKKARGEGKAGPKAVSMRLASPPPPVAEGPDEELEDEADILPPKPAARANGSRPLPSIVARAEAAKGRSASTAFSVPGGDKPYDAPRRGPSIEPRPSGPRLEPAARGGQAAVARQPVVEPVAFLSEPQVAAAMSAVREVELEPQPADPQGAIDRAIATLDREARGESDSAADEVANDVDEAFEPERANGKARGFAAMMPGARKQARQQSQHRSARAALSPPEPRAPAARRGKERGMREKTFGESTGFPRARQEREGSGMSAVAVFLIVFAVLLAGAGGAGYWAMTQGYLDVSKMFAPADPGAAAPAPSTTTTVNASVEPATGVGNTAAPAEAAPATELATEDRLTAEPVRSVTEPLALAAVAPAPEERLSAAGDATAEAAVAALDPVNVAGSQSLLLEASDDGTTGAVPFSGTVDWTKGTDEMGQPTLVGKANIPARNLGVDVLIRRNADPSLPASHLMEINFRVNESFIGGSVAGLPGVLLKNEELVQGTPLVGASARVVGNSFLFALSATPEDLAKNTSLLTERKWMDLALIYATGKRAIITLEKDSNAEGLFGEVFKVWSQTASN